MASKLRQLDSAIPIIAASNGTPRTDIEAIFRRRPFAYIPKPVDFASLEHFIAMACQSR